MLIIVSLLVLIIGALVYGLSNNGKVAELGRIAYSVGLLWFVWQFASNHLHLLDGR